MEQGDAAPQGARLSIEPATPDDRSEANCLWPELESQPEPHEVLVARDAGRCLRGALAIDLYPLPFRIKGSPIRLFVGGGSGAMDVKLALIRAAEQLCRERGGKALYAWDSAAVESAAWDEWHALGFTPSSKLRHYQVELAAYLEMLTPMYDALTVHGRVPIEARVIPLGESPIGEVIQLQIENIGGHAGRLETRLRGGGYYPFDPELSRVAMLNDHVCGMLLAQVDRYRRLTVESRVVAPGNRRRWVNVAVMQEAAQAAVRRGFRLVRFLAHERHQDTHHLARKAGPAMQRRDVMMRLVG